MGRGFDKVRRTRLAGASHLTTGCIGLKVQRTEEGTWHWISVRCVALELPVRDTRSIGNFL